MESEECMAVRGERQQGSGRSHGEGYKDGTIMGKEIWRSKWFVGKVEEETLKIIL